MLIPINNDTDVFSRKAAKVAKEEE